ncbi:MAG: hypothetical protein M3004_11535 [Bacteroidota bacterium]|nr:hypothetical protein [Bacteroidota bacterium]
MKTIFYSLLLLFFLPSFSFAFGDTSNVPLNRQGFHDKIKAEQLRADKMDGKADRIIKVSNSDEVNLAVTDAIFRKIDVLRNDVERNTKLATNNDKIRYLVYIQTVVRNFNNSWRSHSIAPTLAPVLIDNFSKILKAQMRGENMATYFNEVPYEVGIINVAIFKDNPGYKESNKILFLKYSKLHADQILARIAPYVDEPFADTLVLFAYDVSPSQIYTYAQAVNSPQGQLIRRNQDARIKKIVELSSRRDALYFFPFLDDLISGKKTIEEISKYVGSDSTKYDSVGYYKLLVKTEIDYYNRVIKKDTPVAMYGANGLINQLQSKAIKHFITPINDLHEVANPAIRFKALAPLDPQDLYYMIVLGENDIFTSSYKNAFDLMLKKMGTKPHGDSLLLSVNFDHFKKFIKMAAGYNKLDTFLRTMNGSSEVLMRAFVAGLENSSSLEDAVDVADSYGSIRNGSLQKSMLRYVTENEQRCKQNDNSRGQKIYSLLKIIFLSGDSTNHIDLSKEIGIPPVYTIDNTTLANDSGKIVEQVFFYGDKDGKESFASYMQSFQNPDWKIVRKKEWVEIKSLKGKPVWIYANLPLDNETDKDSVAQMNLVDYLDTSNLRPTIVIHRGHSYHLQYTIRQLPESAKIIMLGSCGGYNNLKQILDYAPDAHIISTKQIGAKDVNKPIIEALNNTLRNGKNIDWRQMWLELEVLFTKMGRDKKDLFDDYIPPHKNLGALFIKAYTKAGTS